MNSRMQGNSSVASDLAIFFDPATLARGVEYVAETRVTVLEVDDDKGRGLHAGGAVRGAERFPYAVHARVSIDPGSGRYLAVSSECACPGGSRCEHAAALLVTVLSRADQRRARPATSRPSIPSAGVPTVQLLLKLGRIRHVHLRSMKTIKWASVISQKVGAGRTATQPAAPTRAGRARHRTTGATPARTGPP